MNDDAKEISKEEASSVKDRWIGRIRYANGPERFCVGTTKNSVDQWLEHEMWVSPVLSVATEPS